MSPLIHTPPFILLYSFVTPYLAKHSLKTVTAFYIITASKPLRIIALTGLIVCAALLFIKIIKHNKAIFVPWQPLAIANPYCQ